MVFLFKKGMVLRSPSRRGFLLKALIFGSGAVILLLELWDYLIVHR